MINNLSSLPPLSEDLGAPSLAAVSDLARIAVWEYNPVLRQIRWARPVETVFGYPPGTAGFRLEGGGGDDSPGAASLTAGELAAALVAPITAVLDPEFGWNRYELFLEVIGPDDKVHLALIRARGDTGAEGSPCVGIIADVGAADESPWLLNEVQERLRALVEHSPDAIAVHQGGIVVFGNPAAARMFGVEQATQGFGMPITDFVHPDDIAATVERLATLRAPGDAVTGQEARIVRTDGTIVSVEVASVQTRWDGAPAYQVILRDITERKDNEEKLRHLALHDGLTNLPNRALLYERLSAALQRSEETHRQTAVLFCDLDRFKEVNDTLGHLAGDSLLRVVADRLARCLRPGDTAARLGGDEFALLVEDIDGAPQALALAERVLQTVRAPVHIDGQTIHASVSIGIAVGTADSDPTDLFSSADLAMYRAKKNGSGRELFTDRLRQEVTTTFALERDLRDSMTNGQMRIFYQPIVSLDDFGLLGYEALLRWNHPVHGQIEPAQFIAIAEDIGLINELGMWVMTNAFRQVHRWQRDMGRPIRVAVNVSPTQLAQADFASLVAEALHATGIAPETTVLELTEGVATEDTCRVAATFETIRQLGSRIALDDFGTAFNSLSYLRSFQVDEIKIEQSFIAGIGDPTTQTLLESIINLGRSLHVEVVAEGVETQEQLRWLRDHGCHAAQGFWFAQAMNPPEALSYLQSLRRAAS